MEFGKQNILKWEGGSYRNSRPFLTFSSIELFTYSSILSQISSYTAWQSRKWQGRIHVENAYLYLGCIQIQKSAKIYSCLFLGQGFKCIQKCIGFCFFLNKVNDSTCGNAMLPTLNTDREGHTQLWVFLEERRLVSRKWMLHIIRKAKKMHQTAFSFLSLVTLP